MLKYWKQTLGTSWIPAFKSLTVTCQISGKFIVDFIQRKNESLMEIDAFVVNKLMTCSQMELEADRK